MDESHGSRSPQERLALTTSLSEPSSPVLRNSSSSTTTTPQPLPRHHQMSLSNYSASIFSPDETTFGTQPDLNADQSTSEFRTIHSSSNLATRPLQGVDANTFAALATSKTGPSHEDQVQQAEKDTDDPSASLDPRRGLYRGHSSTSSRLTKLFTGTMPVSPPSSRESSYHNTIGAPISYRRSTPQDATTPLPNHLYQRGLLGGRHSDINIRVFDQIYQAHRIILDRAPFFASALTEPWCEASQKDVTLHPEEIDPNITRKSFELALKRLYGCQDPIEEEEEAMGLFATGCWLEMQDLVEASIQALLRHLCPSNLASTIQFLTTNYYGQAGVRVLAAAKAMLCRDGWEMPLKYWDGIPGEIIKEIVAGDGFFIAGEWDRFILAKRLLNRRLKMIAREMSLWPVDTEGSPRELRQKPIRLNSSSDPKLKSPSISMDMSGKANAKIAESWPELYSHPDIRSLFALLDEGIHYVHLEFEQLQTLRSARDAFEVPILPASIITSALWANLELRQTILNTDEKELTLGLAHQDSDLMDLDLQGPTIPTQKSGISLPEMASMRDNETSSIQPVHFEEPSQAKTSRFWIPSADCNTVVGINSEPISARPGSANRHASSLTATALQNEEPQWANESRASIPQRPLDKQYSHFPPFRFSAQFPNPRTLKERKRVYSRDVFYAGSLWNLYIQKVKSGSKSPQLGVYLHRAKEKEQEDPSSTYLSRSSIEPRTSVEQRIGAMERELNYRNEQPVRSRRHYPWEQIVEAEVSGENSSGDPDSTMIVTPANAVPRTGLSTFMGRTYARKSARRAIDPNNPSTFDDSTSGSELENNNTFVFHDSTSNHNHMPTLPAYVDARPTIKTYFKIYGPSKGGRVLSVYESAPDNFNFSQSWGWKSSTLMLDDEEADDERLAQDNSRGSENSSGMNGTTPDMKQDSKQNWKRAKDGKLRFMVVLGVV